MANFNHSYCLVQGRVTCVVGGFSAGRVDKKYLNDEHTRNTVFSIDNSNQKPLTDTLEAMKTTNYMSY